MGTSLIRICTQGNWGSFSDLMRRQSRDPFRTDLAPPIGRWKSITYCRSAFSVVPCWRRVQTDVAPAHSPSLPFSHVPTGGTPTELIPREPSIHLSDVTCFKFHLNLHLDLIPIFRLIKPSIMFCGPYSVPKSFHLVTTCRQIWTYNFRTIEQVIWYINVTINISMSVQLSSQTLV